MTSRAHSFRRTRRYGWRRDDPDHRDKVFALAPPQPLPTFVDLRTAAWSPPVDQQFALGSCTAQAVCGIDRFEEGRQANLTGLFAPTPAPAGSRLFVYWAERWKEGTLGSDSGAQLRDGLWCASALGIPREADWPYDTSRFDEEPPEPVFAAALLHRATNYARITTPLAGLQCLALGHPWAVGFSLFESFETDDVRATGVVPMPSRDENRLGGHAIGVWGYDQEKRLYLIRNSWGAGWGDGGYGWMPFDYLDDPDLAADRWTIRKVMA